MCHFSATTIGLPLILLLSCFLELFRYGPHRLFWFLQIPAPSDWCYLKLELRYAPFICIGSEKFYCSIVQSTVINLSVAVRMFTPSRHPIFDFWNTPTRPWLLPLYEYDWSVDFLFGQHICVVLTAGMVSIWCTRSWSHTTLVSNY